MGVSQEGGVQDVGILLSLLDGLHHALDSGIDFLCPPEEVRDAVSFGREEPGQPLHISRQACIHLDGQTGEPTDANGIKTDRG
jgi:hypothetical protein